MFSQCLVVRTGLGLWELSPTLVFLALGPPHHPSLSLPGVSAAHSPSSARFLTGASIRGRRSPAARSPFECPQSPGPCRAPADLERFRAAKPPCFPGLSG